MNSNFVLYSKQYLGSEVNKQFGSQCAQFKKKKEYLLF